MSLVNLSMALGIAVEFCAHVLHAFCVSHGSRPARARAALVKVRGRARPGRAWLTPRRGASTLLSAAANAPHPCAPLSL